MRLALLLLVTAIAAAQPGPTTAPHGALHVAGNTIVDSTNQPILLRGTQMADFGFATGTTFSTIRQRWNMNAVRLPVSVTESENDPAYISRIADVVHKANQLELLVILAAHEDSDGMPTARSVQFWKMWAAYFHDNPMVLFDLFSEPLATQIPGHASGIHSGSDWQFWRNSMQPVVDAVRSTGATQVIIAMSLDDEPLLQGFSSQVLLNDPNVVYELCPSYLADVTDAVRDQHFGFLALRVPLLANDWDLKLDETSDECLAVPTDAVAASNLVRDNLGYFDAHNISWTASVFGPGKLLEDFNAYEPTQLYQALSCGQVLWPPQGMGHIVQYHLWAAADPDIITVNGASGSIFLPQGGLAISYGVGMAGSAVGTSPPYPTTLGGISVQLTDSLGATFLTPLKYVSDNQINFLVPVDAASGPAQLSIVRPDRTGPFGKAFLSPIAPGLFTKTANARGAVMGQANGAPISDCDASGCFTFPIVVSPEGTTQVILPATGIRNARSLDEMQATIGGMPVSILSAGPNPDFPGDDRLVLQLGPELSGLGETDLVLLVQGHVSNSVRINIQ